MTNLEPKAALEILKQFGPTDDDKKKIAQSFFGSLIGQSVVLVGLLVSYFVVLGLALKYFAPIKEFRDTFGLLWSVLLLAAPLLFILAFSLVPTLLRGRRENRLKRAVITGDVRFQPGYFRLTPYTKADSATFKRLDDVGDKIFSWLTSTQESLLYLSGASGTGKSSLMAAAIAPKLLALGWMIVESRIFGEPVEHIRHKLLETKGLFAQNPGAELLRLHDLLTLAAQSRAAEGAAPLLLVIDQFEEFLILNKPEERAPFAAFLQELAEKPIDGLRLLLISRSDYRAVIFKLALPPPSLGKNWIEIAPYSRGEATAFLQGGGRQFSEEALDALFRGLDRIEEARGIYRLITLNMVGLILGRVGQKLETDPGKLIQKYLLDCLSSGEGHEFARPLLEHMITDAGTKEPRTEAALVELTGLELWQVKSALTGLGAQGLVRRLEGAEQVWEVSHDFLARIIGRLVGRLKPSLFRRTQPFVAPAILVLWIGFVAFFVPDWLQRNAELRVQKHDMALWRNTDGGLSVRPVASPYFYDRDLLQVMPDLEALKNLTHVDLSGTRVSDIAPLKELKTLMYLKLLDTHVANFTPLKDLESLKILVLSGEQVSDIQTIKDLKNLTDLYLGDTNVADIAPLRDLKSLTSLDLSSTQVKDIAPLKDLKNLRSLILTDTKVTTLAPLRGLPITISGVSEELKATLK